MFLENTTGIGPYSARSTLFSPGNIIGYYFSTRPRKVSSDDILKSILPSGLLNATETQWIAVRINFHMFFF